MNELSKTHGLTFTIGLVAAALTLAACGSDSDGGGDDSAPREVTLMLPFQESTSFFSTLLAQELGYFEEEGINVEVSPSDGGSVALQQVVSGNQDLALVSPGLVLTASAEGSDLVVPYTDKHRNLFSIVVPEGSDVTSVEDLQGGVIGITDLGGGELPLTRAAMDNAGLEEDVNVETLVVGEGGPAVLSAFEDGEIDAYAASWSDFFPLVIAGQELTEIIQPDLAELPSEVLVATPEFAADNGELLDGVTRAMAKASYFTTYDEEAALTILRERLPEELQDPETATRALDLWIGIADVPEVDGEPRYGMHDPEAWETLKQVLGEVADVQDVDISTILDDSHIDAANEFDKSAVEAQADEQGG